MIVNSESRVNKWQSLKYVCHPYNLFDFIFKKRTKYAKYPLVLFSLNSQSG